MNELLSNYWLWIVLGIGAVWLLTRMGGSGCGMAGHGSHSHQHEEGAGKQPPPISPVAGKDPEGRGVESQAQGTTKRESSHRHAECC